MINRGIIVITIAILTSYCNPNSDRRRAEEKVEKEQLNLALIADKLVERMDLQAGERALLVMQPGRFDALIPILEELITAKGANYLG